MALQLQKLGLPQHLVLADERQTCTAAHARWNWLGCGWSGGLPAGWLLAGAAAFGLSRRRRA
jgi:hypothetical protein